MTALSIQQFNLTRARLYAGGAFFRSKIHGPSANKICLQFQNGVLKIQNMPVVPSWVKKYDGFSKIQFDGQQILVNDQVVAIGNELKTSENRIIFPQEFSIEPITEVFEIDIIQDTLDGVQILGYSLEDARTKIQASNMVTMPIRPSGDVNAIGVDGAFIQPFERIFMQGGAGLPTTALQCDTGPFKTLAKVSGIEDDVGVISPIDQIYQWVGETKNLGYWTTY